MEFDASFREDFPFLSSLFPENNSNSTFNPDLGGSTFPFPGEASASASSSKALVHDFILNQDHVSHNSTPGATNGGSRSSNPHHFHHFPIDRSSKNPFFEDSSTYTDPFAEPYTGGFSSDLNAYIPSLSFTVPDHGAASNNGLIFQAFQNTEPRWDFSQNKPSAQQPLLSPPETDDRQIHQQRDQTPPPPPRPRPRPVADEVSCASTADQNGNNNNNSNQNEVDENNNRRPQKSPRLNRAVKKTNVVKGQWTPQEDRLLIQLVSRYGTKRWSQIAKLLDERVGKQCRERWHNHLRPDIKKDSWSEEEDMILIAAHREMGNKWAEIAKILPGRSENTIKNHWNAAKRRQNSRRKARDGTSPEPSLLQNYIKSISSTSTSTPPVTTQHDNAKMVFEITNPETITDPHLVQLENSGFNHTGWDMEALNHQIRRQRQQQQQEMEYSVDANVYNDQISNQSFGSMIGEASSSNGMENFELPLEMDSLRKEMDFLEMISQGNL
ncbi:hypothetical protein HRI_000508300 [Hibiscus trionum]|uniref:Uncharacterized protein n=1 Tax=Hibiscus trionum TaxID=183268 RepID=A0A9W7LM90_HIBTR|nr:hypothetical protein HRI_000508300 [Hibiscus trionum]